MSVNTQLKTKMTAYEKSIILDALERNKYSRKATAIELDITRVTLYNKMVLHGMIPQSVRAAAAKGNSDVAAV